MTTEIDWWVCSMYRPTLSIRSLTFSFSYSDIIKALYLYVLGIKSKFFNKSQTRICAKLINNYLKIDASVKRVSFETNKSRFHKRTFAYWVKTSKLNKLLYESIVVKVVPLKIARWQEVRLRFMIVITEDITANRNTISSTDETVWK